MATLPDPMPILSKTLVDKEWVMKFLASNFYVGLPDRKAPSGLSRSLQALGFRCTETL